MISQYIFKLLSLDATDSTASSVLPDVKARMDNPDLIAGDLPDYTYTSLKTLLGEASNSNVNTYGQPEWAVNRIIDIKDNAKFRRIEDPDNWPIVLIGVTNLQPDPKEQAVGAWTAHLEIMVQTKPNQAASTQAFSLIQRINSQFRQYTPSGIETPREIVAAVTGIKGLSSLQVLSPLIPISAWDVQRAVFPVKARIIQ